jgi:hypothetical protein
VTKTDPTKQNPKAAFIADAYEGRLASARAAFPNNEGNYRRRKSPARPMTQPELYAAMVAADEACGPAPLSPPHKLWTAVLIAAAMGVGGCNAYVVDRTADGTIHLAGASLLTDKGVQRATITGLGSVEGYSNSVNADALAAVVAAAVNAARGAK